MVSFQLYCFSNNSSIRNSDCQLFWKKNIMSANLRWTMLIEILFALHTGLGLSHHHHHSTLQPRVNLGWLNSCFPSAGGRKGCSFYGGLIWCYRSILIWDVRVVFFLWQPLTISISLAFDRRAVLSGLSIVNDELGFLGWCHFHSTVLLNRCWFLCNTSRRWP